MDPDKLDVVEAGVLTASEERWAQAETRFARVSSIAGRSTVCPDTPSSSRGDPKATD